MSEAKPDDILDAAYKHVESMTARADAWQVGAPMWYGWAVREAFAAGAAAERERSASVAAIAAGPLGLLTAAAIRKGKPALTPTASSPSPAEIME